MTQTPARPHGRTRLAVALAALAASVVVAGCSADEKAGVTDLSALSADLKAAKIACAAPGDYAVPDQTDAIGDLPIQQMKCTDGAVPLMVAVWDTSASADRTIDAIVLQACVTGVSNSRYVNADDWIMYLDSDGDVTHPYPNRAGFAPLSGDAVTALADRITAAIGGKFHVKTCRGS